MTTSEENQKDEDEKGPKNNNAYEEIEVLESSGIETTKENTGGTTSDNDSSIRSSDDRTIVDPEESRITNRGKSDIETLARTIDDRFHNRLRVTFWERKYFLDICLEVSKKERYGDKTGQEEEEEEGSGSLSRFSKEGLIRLVEEIKGRVAKKPNVSRFYDELLKLIGYYDPDKSMLRLFEAGLKYTENSNEDEFYFRDFNFYFTVIASKYGLMRIPGFTMIFSLLTFYFGSAVLFCVIMDDQNVCPTTDDNSSYHDGWLTTIYFASVTMSTVGYGDVSLYEYGQPKWITFIAIVYMLVAMAVALSVFSKLADTAMHGIGMCKARMFSKLKTKIMESKDIPLYEQVRRLIALRVVELLIYFFALNLFGVFVARVFISRSDVEEQQWNWMTTLYWAIQTTTTIGTAFVGTCLGSLAGLHEEINDHRRYHAWKRRELSKMMIDELQVNDDKLDQYEFVIGSLLILQKVTTADIDHIMDKFRDLAGDKKFILVSDEMDGNKKISNNNNLDLVESKNGGVSRKNCDFVDVK